MAAFCLTQLAIATFNILLVLLFVVANKDFCGSVFETQVDHALVGHVMIKTVVVDEFECHLKCHGNNSCKSFNVLDKGDINAKIRFCELNNETRETKPGDFKKVKGSTNYGPVQISCIDVNSVCGPVGVADRNKIPDARMTASSFGGSWYHPYYGRLNETRGKRAWCPKTTYDRTDYLHPNDRIA